MLMLPASKSVTVRRAEADRERIGLDVLLLRHLSRLLVRRVGKRRFGRAAARSHDEVDVSDFVAVTDERFADAELVYLGHA